VEARWAGVSAGGRGLGEGALWARKKRRDESDFDRFDLDELRDENRFKEVGFGGVASAIRLGSKRYGALRSVRIESRASGV
jgi:hypothetical protein